jgi:hypothetical protein
MVEKNSMLVQDAKRQQGCRERVAAFKGPEIQVINRENDKKQKKQIVLFYFINPPVK